MFDSDIKIDDDILGNPWTKQGRKNEEYRYHYPENKTVQYGMKSTGF